MRGGGGVDGNQRNFPRWDSVHGIADRLSLDASHDSNLTPG